jgi:hypothetical protein
MSEDYENSGKFRGDLKICGEIGLSAEDHRGAF